MRLRTSLIAVSLLLASGVTVTGCDEKKTQESATASSASTNQGVTEAPKTEEDGAQAEGGLPFEATGPVATIAGTEVTAKDYNDEVEKIVKLTNGRISPQMVHFYKKQVLYRLVDERLLQEEVEKAGVSATDEEVTTEFDKFVKRFPSKEQFDEYFKRSGMTEEEIRKDMKSRIAQEKMLVKKYDIKVEDADVKKFYEENKERFTEQEQVKASHILLKLPAEADDKMVAEVEKKAKELSKKAKAKGADFEAMAKEFSEGPSAPRGGELGFFPAGRMVKEFSDVAFKLKKGEVSGPVRTQFGFHIIKTEDKKDANTKSFDEVREMIEDQLKVKQLRENMNTMLKELKEQKQVTFKEENIKVNMKMPEPGENPMMGNPHGGMIPGHGAGDGHGHAHGAEGDGHDHDGKPAGTPKAADAPPTE